MEHSVSAAAFEQISTGAGSSYGLTYPGISVLFYEELVNKVMLAGGALHGRSFCAVAAHPL